ncbi:MAG: class I SAM-dependent methyltransferase [Anaerolineae bacterium]
MSGTPVDYDQLAATYDRRFAQGAPRGVAIALRALARQLDARRILEVGCGTGYWLAGLAGPPPRSLCGLDLSTGMLAQARSREPSLCLVQGRASHLPFPPASFDLVYCVNAIHHFERPAAFIAEARRLIRPGGVLAVVGSDPRQPGDRWYVYDYFPGTYKTDLNRFPSWGTMLDWMVAAGFEPIQWKLVEKVVSDKVGRAVLADPFLAKGAVSQLALLSDEAYAAGLDRIEAALAGAEAMGKMLAFPVTFALAMLAGRVPP